MVEETDGSVTKAITGGAGVAVVVGEGGMASRVGAERAAELVAAVVAEAETAELEMDTGEVCGVWEASVEGLWRIAYPVGRPYWLKRGVYDEDVEAAVRERRWNPLSMGRTRYDRVTRGEWERIVGTWWGCGSRRGRRYVSMRVAADVPLKWLTDRLLQEKARGMSEEALHRSIEVMGALHRAKGRLDRRDGGVMREGRLNWGVRDHAARIAWMMAHPGGALDAIAGVMLRLEEAGEDSGVVASSSVEGGDGEGDVVTRWVFRLLDGNHRLAAAFFRKDRTIQLNMEISDAEVMARVYPGVLLKRVDERKEGGE
jgi:hypothetical protein